MSFNVQNSTGITNISILKREYQPPIVTISTCWISDWIESLLKAIAVNRLGPTIVSRWLFVASNCIYNSYQFVTEGKTAVDMQYWKSSDKGSLIISEDALQSWMEYACQYFFPILYQTYMKITVDVSSLVNNHKPLIQIDQNSLDKLKTLLSSYLAARDADGWKTTTAFDGTLPNGSNYIIADNSSPQNLNTLPEPYKWTPLYFSTVGVRNYLTPEWGTKNKGILPESDFLSLLNTANQLFPSLSQFQAEVNDVKNIAAALTDKEKMTAEFWAGGPGTVTPPGMWMVFADLLIRSNQMSLANEIKLYTTIASGLYEAGICAWRLKRDKLQARPIQMIRETQYGNTIPSWNGNISGEYWLPFQELNFVTPPFPDFVSGHSTFSSTSARLMSYILQSDIISLKTPVISNDIINYLSPVLTNGSVNFCLNDVFIYPNSSKIQANVPLSGVLLNWTNWSEMAKNSGASRIFGGIHVESSNQAGLLLGRNIGDKLWNLLKNL